MDTTASQTAFDSKPYTRARHIEREPVCFAVGLLALVVAISLWQPVGEQQPPATHAQATQVAATPTASTR